jgi:hypothetical protein
MLADRTKNYVGKFWYDDPRRRMYAVCSLSFPFGSDRCLKSPPINCCTAAARLMAR